ncbi:MAG TPA: glycogen-binding domain-containing protein [Gemmatimonadaceae bacterium]
MSDAERDPVLRRALDELRKLPPADVAAMRRVVAAAAAARVTPFDSEPGVLSPRRGRSIRLWMAVGIAAASAFVGFVLRGAWTSKPDVAQVAAGASTIVDSTRSAMRTVAATELEAAPVSQQFVFNDSRAHKVSVVGDFNRWNPTTTPMVRSADGELWSVTIPILPGRHMYAFIVDDSMFTLDPTAPKARDPDLGADGSIVVVGRP